MHDVLSETQRFKLFFLIGLFVTNLIRFILLLCEAFADPVPDGEPLSNTSIALIDLPTLGLMTSFSLFIYYMAQLTLQLEMEQMGLYDDDTTNLT